MSLMRRKIENAKFYMILKITMTFRLTDVS